MTRSHFACALACLLALSGCDDGDPDTDAGTVTGTDSGAAGGTDGGPMMTDTDGGMTPPGTDGGPVTGTDAGPVTGTDAGPPVSADAGPPPACDMGRIRLQEDCGEFTACGGALEGSWCYSDVCVEEQELLNQVFSADVGPPFDGLVENCRSQRDLIDFTDATGSIDGTIEATSTTLRRTATNLTSGRVYLPEMCKVFNNCGATATALSSFSDAIEVTDCMDEMRGASDGGAGCNCMIAFESNLPGDLEAYTRVDDDTIRITESGQTFDYCVSEGNLVFRDVTVDGEGAPSPIEPGTQTALPDGA